MRQFRIDHLRQDLIVALSIGVMFLGAFILPSTPLGFVLIGGGGLSVLVLICAAIFSRD